MKFTDYFKDRLWAVFISALFFMLFVAIMFSLSAKWELIIIFSVMFFTVCFLILFMDFFRRRSFYNSVKENLESLDKKHLIIETVDLPHFLEGRLFYYYMYEINKSMSEQINDYRDDVHRFKEYIEMWIHEIKIPISGGQLMCHNYPNEANQKVLEQIKKIDGYTEQILYYVRSENAEKDYLIREVNLKNVVKNVAVKNKDVLLERNIAFEANNLDFTVTTDEKWLEFMVNQIVSNSIRYTATVDNPKIKVFAEEKDKTVSLHIRDNGIGIPDYDLPKIYEKSFTGKNGRRFSKSTGMGLYIIKRLCMLLGHKINILSKENEYTEVIFDFYINDYGKVSK